MLKQILEAKDSGGSKGSEGSEGSEGDERVCAMAFGPGLTVETALLTREPAAPKDAESPVDGALVADALVAAATGSE